jgi:hypothetical protein
MRGCGTFSDEQLSRAEQVDLARYVSPRAAA